jgi:hypothetical protein
MYIGIKSESSPELRISLIENAPKDQSTCIITAEVTASRFQLIELGTCSQDMAIKRHKDGRHRVQHRMKISIHARAGSQKDGHSLSTFEC